MNRVDQIARILSYGLFPPRCTVCGNSGLPSLDLCQLCLDELPEAPPVVAFGNGRIFSGFTYHKPIDGLIQRFKFQEQLQAGLLLARLAMPAFVSSRPAALLPVPLHPTRLRGRGFNQSLELAKFWGKQFSIPVMGQALQRQRATRVQSSLKAAERSSNVEGAFLVRHSLPHYVALIDDVVTTGATCQAAAQALRGAGVGRVDVWCLARVP